MIIRPKEKTIETGYAPHKYQEIMHRLFKRFTVAVCHRRFGKTVFSVNHGLHYALRNRRLHPPPRYAYIAPFLNQAKTIGWDYLLYHTRDIPGIKKGINKSELSIRLPHNGAVFRLYGADNANALRGGYLDGAMIDEVADFKPGVWSTIIRPMLAEYKGWGLFTGTPRGINEFYELYQRGLTGRTGAQ